MLKIALVGIASNDRDDLVAGLALVGYSSEHEPWDSAAAVLCDRPPSAILLNGELDASRAIRLCAMMRAGGYVGALVLLVRSREQMIAALHSEAADDCVFAPVDCELLAARIQAVLHRASAPSLRTCRPLFEIVPENTARVAHFGDRMVRLTPIESRILASLRDAQGELVPAQQLRRAACLEAPLSRDSLQVHIAHLRSKLGADAWRVQNCRSLGYRFSPLAQRHDRAG